MYSDSDIEAFELDVYAHSSDEADASDEVEQQIQMREAALSIAYQAYTYFFDAEEGFFRSTFASQYRTDADENAVMTSVDSWFPTTEEVACVLNAHTDETAAEGAAQPPSSATTPPQAAAPAPANATTAAVSTVANWPEEGKPSPASRFLCANGEACILVPVDKSLNRAALRAAHKDHFTSVASLGADGLDVVPGYDKLTAVGWALPLSTDPAVLDVLKSLYPGWRLPTPQDVRFFAKPSSSLSVRAPPGENGALSPQLASPPQPQRRAWTRNAAKLMSSKERLLACIAAAGGWASVVFVALDVEAYAVTAHSVPIPAEFAFVSVPVTTGGVPPVPLHFFCHPGRVSPEDESTILHTCVNTHFIPYRNAAFLATDFVAKADEVDRQFVRNPAVVFINKGSPTSPTLMDLQALRWLYAAARCQVEYRAGDGAATGDADAVGVWIPRAEDIHCFDISVLETVAAECGSACDTSTASSNAAAGGGEPKVGDGPSSHCWYHAEAANLDTEKDGVHCAMHDANILADRIKAALRIHRPTRLS